MTEQKETIQLANGLAEEGDIVKCSTPICKGMIGISSIDGEVNIFREVGDTLKIVDSKREHGGLQVWSGYCFLAFSPSDALEAVEEVKSIVKSRVRLGTISERFGWIIS